MTDERPAMHLARYGLEGAALCGVTHVARKPEIAIHDETCPKCLAERTALAKSNSHMPLVGVRTLP